MFISLSSQANFVLYDTDQVDRDDASPLVKTSVQLVDEDACAQDRIAPCSYYLDGLRAAVDLIRTEYVVIASVSMLVSRASSTATKRL